MDERKGTRKSNKKRKSIETEFIRREDRKRDKNILIRMGGMQIRDDERGRKK